jgi:MYXO-CTERM domain-containing protein
MLSILLATPAFAFAPTDGAGIEPDRLRTFHAPAQGRLRHQPAWVEFTQGEGAGWLARFDELTGLPHRAWGPGIPMPGATAKDVERSLRAFFSRNADVIGVGTADLRLRRATLVERTGTWYVDFDQLVRGAPVWRGGVTARIRDGRLVLLGVDTWPGARVEAAEIASDEAEIAAQVEGGAPLADHRDVQSTLVVLPWQGERGWELRPAWQVTSRTRRPVGAWVTHVDAVTGDVLNSFNAIRFISGTITGTHDTRTVDGNFTTSALPLIRLIGDDSGSTTYADESGVFDMSDDGSALTSLHGDYLDVDTRLGDDGEMTVTGSATFTDEDATQAEIDTYKFVHDVRDWCMAIAPEVGMCTRDLTANVNDRSGTCNAYYDGNLNFYFEGGGCNNTGRIADVVYHEWGHGFHYYSVESGYPDGTVGEGIGDAVAELLTLDSELAPYFYQGSATGIRDSAPDRVYPDDVVGEVHEDGLIFAGAVWDLRTALSETTGEATDVKGDAWTTTSTLLADAIKANPTTETAYDEFIAADDDDGDSTNGTPHMCEIVEAFGLHGLGPGGTEDLVTVAHEAVGNQAPETVVPVSGEVVSLAACAAFDPAEAAAVYTTDGENWFEAELSVSGADVQGELPGFPEDTIVQYYLRATSTDGDTVTVPAGGDIAPYTFYVGTLEELYCESFAESDGGYAHELLDGPDAEGADDWQYGTPRGESTDPTGCFTGDACWGNDLGAGNYNGEYQSGVTNRLSSPAIDLGSQTEVILQYRRWLHVEDGFYDQARVYANDSAVWENHASAEAIGDEHTEDAEWMLHTLRASDLSDTLTLGWEIESDRGLEFGGWTLDDVCVYAPISINELFAVTDFVASDDLTGTVTLSWTQPAHDDAAAATVVRRADRFAANRDDGDVVFDGAADPGTAQVVTDAHVGTAWYAVFVGDGADRWLTGASQGANADQGTGLGDGSGDTGGGDGGRELAPLGFVRESDCGCATGSGPAAGAGWLAAIAFVLRRRR